MANYVSIYGIVMKKIVVLVETRKHKALEFILLNICTVLNKEWKIQIFHGLDNYKYIQNIINNNSLKNRVILTNLNISSVTQEDSSKIMLSVNFWNQVQGETILYICYQSFKELIFHKPLQNQQSREFYVIGKGFLGIKEDILALKYVWCIEYCLFLRWPLQLFKN